MKIDTRRHPGARISSTSCRRTGGSRWRSCAGSGARLYDADGREYLDLVSGIGVASLGHAHPGLAAAIADQASTLLHTSNLYFHPFQAEAAARLAALSGLAARLLLQQRHRGQRSVPEVRAPLLAHAGRDEPRRASWPSKADSPDARMGALSVTLRRALPRPFMPLHRARSPFVDPDRPGRLLAAVINDTTAAIIAEPIRGEGGVHPLLAGVRAGDQRRLPAHGHAAHCRRSAERAWPHRLRVSTSRRSAGSRT